MSKEFEKELINKEFTLLECKYTQCKCDDSCIDKKYIWYYQQCSCCLSNDFIVKNNMSKYLEWYKCTSCNNCIDEISSLYCGGHYENFRIFSINVENNIEHIDLGFNLSQCELNPNKIIIDFEE